MRTEEEITADADATPPFSNNTMWELFAEANCSHGSGCVYDDAYGGAPEGTNCPLITVAIVSQRTPQEWIEEGEIGECKAYEEVVAHATDDEPADAEELPDGWRPVDVLPTQEGLF